MFKILWWYAHKVWYGFNLRQIEPLDERYMWWSIRYSNACRNLDNFYQNGL